MQVGRRIISVLSIVVMILCIAYFALCLMPKWNAISFASSVLLGSIAPWVFVLAIMADLAWIFVHRGSWRRTMIGIVGVLLAVPVPLTAIAHNTFLGTNNAAVNFVGATPEQEPDTYRALDATNWVTPEMPPTLILQGGEDSFVPPESVRTYVEAARSAGADVKLVEAPLENHAFDISFRNSIGWQLATSVALNFLTTH